MNLGQAVAVCLYELSSRAVSPRATESGSTDLPAEGQALRPAAAASGKLDLLSDVIEEAMLAAGYSPRSMQAANRHDLRLLLRRLAPSERDARRMLGLFRRILWRLKQDPNRK
jgi:tRNA/rRNA methyltransferase